MERISKAKVALVRSLANKKMRLKHGLFAIEGNKSVADILFDYASANPCRVDFIMASPQWIDHNFRKLRDAKIPDRSIFEADPASLQKASSLSTPPDVIAVCRMPENADDRNQTISGLPEKLYLVLDGIQDPGNLGTIIRTAHWFGISSIFASPSTADCFNPKVIQSSMGSFSAVKVIYTDLPELIDSNPDLPLVGLVLDGESIFTCPLPSYGFIAMGNEGSGLSAELHRRVNLPLTIPPFSASRHAESLNVAIATGITLAQFRK